MEFLPSTGLDEKQSVRCGQRNSINKSNDGKMTQNLWCAAGYNTIALPIAAGGLSRVRIDVAA
jgi:hypothetical protein